MTDEEEPPDKPAAPQVSASTLNSLTISWDAPTNTGPAISSYDVRYILTNAPDKGDENWTLQEEVWNSDMDTDFAYTISPLSQNTGYDIQVRAENEEGTGAWSDSGVGMTVENQSPTFSEGSSATRSFAENTGSGEDIGTPVNAIDNDGGTLVYSLEGDDAGSFDLVTDSGQLETKANVIYDYEDKNSYLVTVKVVDGQGGSATIDVTITLTDENEAPVFAAVSAPSVSENSTADVVTVSASDADADDNITGYSIVEDADGSQFEVTDEGVLSFKVAPNYEAPTDVEVTTPANGEKNNEYIVIVSATSGEGARVLTATQTVTVTVEDVNEAPIFAEVSPITVSENSTGVIVTVSATDADSKDDITGYGIVDGGDGSQFSITDMGALSFQTAPNFEASSRCG